MDLYRIVEEYADLGEHRTGTPTDAATTEWLAGRLADLGLTVDVEPFEYERWVCESDLLADGEAVDHLPVFYEFTGRVETTSPEVVEIDTVFGGIPSVLDGPIGATLERGGEALVIATEHPDGALVAVNRMPDAGSGLPTVLVPGREYERLRGAKVELTMDARLVAGQTATLLGSTPVSGSRLMLTTPLTGWFRCAGERGTGIAVLLDLITRLTDLPLAVVATTGHELDYLGARRWSRTTDLDPAAVLHLGASIAVDEPASDGTRIFSDLRRARTNLGADESAAMESALSPARLPLTSAAREFFGEASVFSDFEVPLLSLTGAGTDFHTPEDLPAKVTSAGSLRITADAVYAALAQLDPRVRPDG